MFPSRHYYSPDLGQSGRPVASVASNVTTEAMFYGREQISTLIARYVAYSFACPNDWTLNLENFVAYALHRAKLSDTVAFTALLFLQRLKGRMPACTAKSGHRLFITAYVLAAKVLYDDAYSNKSWCTVAKDVFSLRELNKMERDMCSYLAWDLTVDAGVLASFTAYVQYQFSIPEQSVGLLFSVPAPSYATLDTNATNTVAHDGLSHIDVQHQAAPLSALAASSIEDIANASAPSLHELSENIPDTSSFAVPPYTSGQWEIMPEYRLRLGNPHLGEGEFTQLRPRPAEIQTTVDTQRFAYDDRDRNLPVYPSQRFDFGPTASSYPHSDITYSTCPN